MYYEIDIAGKKRNLQLYEVGENTDIAAFILFGDVQITQHAAAKLLEKAPDFDIMLTAEAKSIPLIYEMARQAGMNDYIVARKGVKVYMENVLSVEVKSITTDHIQHLYLGDNEVSKIKGKKVLIIDDVISTGESLAAMEELVKEAGGITVGKMTVLAEGDAKNRDDIMFLGELPLFDGQGQVK